MCPPNVTPFIRTVPKFEAEGRGWMTFLYSVYSIHVVVQWLHCGGHFLVDIDGKYKEPHIFHPLPWLHVHVYSQSSLFQSYNLVLLDPSQLSQSNLPPAQEPVYSFLFLKPFFHLHHVKENSPLHPSLRDTSELGCFIVTTIFCSHLSTELTFL